MNDDVQPPAASEENGDAPVSLVKNPVSLAQVLGKIRSEGAELLGSPAANSTRWVFDVATDSGKQIAIELLDFRSDRPLNPDVMSFSFTPGNRAAYKAQPVLREDGGMLIIDTLKTEETAVFRVFVDVMHSATR